MEKPAKQTVYLPVKVEDELPEYNSKEFTIDSKGRKSVHHTLKVLDENKELYDKNGFLNFGDESHVIHWLKSQEGYVFTPEQLNEYTANIIKQALKNASEKAVIKYDHFDDMAAYVDTRSIVNTFDEMFDQFKV